MDEGQADRGLWALAAATSPLEMHIRRIPAPHPPAKRPARLSPVTMSVLMSRRQCRIVHAEHRRVHLTGKDRHWQFLFLCILAGTSSSGVVISGVADRVPERISQLVYVDAFVPKMGRPCSTSSRRGNTTTRR